MRCGLGQGSKLAKLEPNFESSSVAASCSESWACVLLCYGNLGATSWDAPLLAFLPRKSRACPCSCDALSLPSLPFPSLPFPSLSFPSLPFPSLPFPFLSFPFLSPPFASCERKAGTSRVNHHTIRTPKRWQFCTSQGGIHDRWPKFENTTSQQPNHAKAC